MASLKRIIPQFKKQLLELYVADDYNPTRAFYAYIGFLRTFGGRKLRQFEDWQVQDLLMSLWNDKIKMGVEALETAWNATRRMGKSRGLTVDGVFVSLLDKDVIWRAPHSDQLSQAGSWFEMNPFVKKVSIAAKNEIQVYNSPPINIGVLSEGKVASREADLLIYDEGGWVFKNRKLYEYYKASRPMIAASDFRVIIHASTPARNTAFHEEWLALKKLEIERNTTFTIERPWKMCPWITPEWVDNERKKHADTPWYVDQNYNCIWVVYGGAVFTKIITVGDPHYLNEDGSLRWPYGYLSTRPLRVGGVDFNAGDRDKPHYIVKGDYDAEYVYVCEEIPFTEMSELFKQGNCSLELEDGLFNNQFTEQTRRMGLECTYLQWNEADKQERVQDVRDRTVIIDPAACPLTYRNLMEAGYDQNSRLPKLEKRNDQHGLDCLLHMMHPYDGRIYISERGMVRQKSRLLGGRGDRQLRY